MRPEHSADIARTLKNISDEVHHSQANNKEIKIHLIRMASVVTSTIQLEIQKAEELQHHQKSRTSNDNSSQSITESDRQSNAEATTSQPSADKKERRTLKKFVTIYRRVPQANAEEPIAYLERETGHDDDILVQILKHYLQLKTDLKALLEIETSKTANLTALRNAATFQDEILEYIMLCNRHIRTLHKARRATAERHGVQYIPYNDITDSTEEDAFNARDALL